MHHLAFRVGSPRDVGPIHDAVLRIPARLLRAPRSRPEYCADYYGPFFKDSEGIEYEVVGVARRSYYPS